MHRMLTPGLGNQWGDEPLVACTVGGGVLLTALITTAVVLQPQLPDEEGASLINAGGPPEALPFGIVIDAGGLLP